MGAIGTKIEFDNGLPTIEAIAREFRDATGLELVVEPFGASSFSLSAPLLGADVELNFTPVFHMVRSRPGLGYFEWGILRALHRLGGRVPAHVFPRYTSVPWARLSWFTKWRHR